MQSQHREEEKRKADLYHISVESELDELRTAKAVELRMLKEQ